MRRLKSSWIPEIGRESSWVRYRQKTKQDKKLIGTVSILNTRSFRSLICINSTGTPRDQGHNTFDSIHGKFDIPHQHAEASDRPAERPTGVDQRQLLDKSHYARAPRDKLHASHKVPGITSRDLPLYPPIRGRKARAPYRRSKPRTSASLMAVLITCPEQRHRKKTAYSSNAYY